MNSKTLDTTPLQVLVSLNELEKHVIFIEETTLALIEKLFRVIRKNLKVEETKPDDAKKEYKVELAVTIDSLTNRLNKANLLLRDLIVRLEV